MDPFRQGLGDMRSASGASLRRISGVHQHHFPPSIFCFGLKDVDELTPTGVTDALGQGMVPNHVGYSEVFSSNEATAFHQHVSSLVMEVTTGIPDTLMLPSQDMDSLASAIATLPSARDPLLGLDQCGLGPAQETGVRDLFPIAGGQEALQSHIDTDSLKSGRQWDSFNLTGEHGVPPATLPLDGQRLGGALQGAVQLNLDGSDLGQAKRCAIQSPADAGLGKGDGVVVNPGTEPWIAGCLTSLATPVEALKGPIHPVEDVLKDLAEHFTVVWDVALDERELGRLAFEGDTIVAHPPGIPTLLKRGVVEDPASIKRQVESLGLHPGWIEPVLKRSSDFQHTALSRRLYNTEPSNTSGGK